MCEKHYCTHSPETLCSCAPVQSGDVAQIVFHMAENMEDIRWELDYKSLADLSGHRLCAMGKCRQCGGRLCAGQYPVDAQTPEDFLAAVYRQLNQFHRRLDAALSHPAFRERFAAMFHEEDRPFVEDWLVQREAKTGAIMARDEAERGGVPDVDFVAGVPDSGVPHAMGYANHSGKPLARPFVKYTPTWPRSFMPEDQQVRSRVARMKQIPVPELIEGKKLLFVDDSIVRGTQLRETVDFLYSTGAAEVHMRSACPPIMYPCRYLNFSRGNSAMDLLARRMVQELEGNEGQKHLEEYADSRTERGKCLLHEICAQFGFDSLSYQSLDGLLEAIGIDRDKVCTYCWTGKE